MKTSVALCTYNGEKFLAQQLESILNQTVLVDEIVVCDDGSTDNTVSILENYRKEHPNTIKIYKNEKNLRSVKNFEKAISLCNNEIIFLSDQDDVWKENKVEKILIFFNENPNKNSVCTNGKGIDEQGRILDKLTIWDTPQILRNSNIEVNFFNIIAYIENIATGAGMAFRKNIIGKIVPFPSHEGFHHDEWIALVTSHEKSFDMIDDKLFFYRVHPEQQVGGVLYKNTKKVLKEFINHFDLFADDKTFSQYKKLLKRLSESHKKHSALLKNNDSMNMEISIIIIEDTKKHFDAHKINMERKYPFRSLILNVFDSFNRKRKID